VNRIDYALIAQALSYYEGQGFTYIEVPWIVSKKAVEVTLPEGRAGLHCADGTLVGSAEQSFIHMAMNHEIKPGRYMAASPCFRDDTPDEWHQRTFFKVEMIDLVDIEKDPNADDSSVPWYEMAQIALGFFRRFEPTALIEGSIVNEYAFDSHHEPGADITLDGIELGSYGRRAMKGWRWTYGTGLAEPRFSMARDAVRLKVAALL
jgi:hypothetical protein